ncbi:unnamed protein product, partial [marine sediment metagenome]
PIVSETLALMVIDPYLWTSAVLYLNEFGAVNHLKVGYEYPWGFAFFCGGNLLISPDFATTYLFMKYACFPFLNFYTLVLFSITKRFFKRPSLIFFCLISILPNTYFLYRIIMFLSSSIAVLLILISFIIIMTEAPNYLLGFILPATLLMNPVYTLFFSLALIIFYFVRIIVNIRNIISIIKEILAITILSFIFIIPYIISIYILFDFSLNEFIRSYFWLFRTDSLHLETFLINNRRKSGFTLYVLNFFI